MDAVKIRRVVLLVSFLVESGYSLAKSERSHSLSLRFFKSLLPQFSLYSLEFEMFGLTTEATKFTDVDFGINRSVTGSLKNDTSSTSSESSVTRSCDTIGNEDLCGSLASSIPSENGFLMDTLDGLTASMKLTVKKRWMHLLQAGSYIF